MKEKTGLKGVVIFFVDFSSIDTSNNLDIRKYKWLKEYDVK